MKGVRGMERNGEEWTEDRGARVRVRARERFNTNTTIHSHTYTITNNTHSTPLKRPKLLGPHL